MPLSDGNPYWMFSDNVSGTNRGNLTCFLYITDMDLRLYFLHKRSIVNCAHCRCCHFTSIRPSKYHSYCPVTTMLLPVLVTLKQQLFTLLLTRSSARELLAPVSRNSGVKTNVVNTSLLFCV